mmetsp:Transcript_18551/g.59089  ORF Transcript_18551/g.59089 Transcript_18551/m.59089 type:complete len:397 (-) Transcript_18551:98-1288(-)
MVLLRRIREGEKHERVSFGACFNTQPSLSFDVDADDGTSLTLHFVAAPTRSLAEAVETLRNCDGQPAAPAVESCPESGPRLQRRESVYSSVRHVVAAGGGAHKYAALFEEVLRVRLVPFAELAALVEGLHFLRAVGPADELYALPGPAPGGDGSGSAATSGGEGVASEAAEKRVAWEEVDFPYIVVNIGSGVSVLLLEREGCESPGEGRGGAAGGATFRRVGGTACGGATFLGLGRALTGVADYHKLLALAEAGDASLVDTTVGDIYGEIGCAALGFPPSMTAVNFGALAHGGEAPLPAKRHLAAAVLQLVVQASVLQAMAHATPRGAADRVLFVGGFLSDNQLARRLVANTTRKLGGRALFSRHADFLGGLGSLAETLHRRAEGVSQSARNDPHR